MEAGQNCSSRRAVFSQRKAYRINFERYSLYFNSIMDRQGRVERCVSFGGGKGGLEEEVFVGESKVRRKLNSALIVSDDEDLSLLLSFLLEAEAVQVRSSRILELAIGG